MTAVFEPELDALPVRSTTRRAAVARTILVTDGDERAALALVRAYGAAGHRVIVAAPGARSLAGASRHARHRVIAPSALRDPDAFAAAVRAAAQGHAVEVIVPVSEASLLALLPLRESLAPARLPCPSLAQFAAICDKSRVLQAARALGIAVPQQTQVADAAALDSLASADDLEFPLVLKPARSVAEHEGKRAKLTVRHAATRDQLRALAAELPPAAYPLLAQQRIVGPGEGVFALVWDGTPRALFAHRRLREKPPSGGVSVLRESIAAPAALVERSLALLAHFDWQGVAMVEYKVDASTGTPYLMEINGRFWGSLQLAIDAGVDFPNLLVGAAYETDGAGDNPSAPPSWRTGVRLRWWWGDVDHLVARLRHSPASLALPSDSPSRARAVADFLRPDFASRNETLRLDDPMPFFLESIRWLRGR